MGTNKNQTKTNEEPHQKTTKTKGVIRSQAPYRWANGSSHKPARDSNPESPDFQQPTPAKKINLIL
jgi:hypothetical protein